MGRKRGHVRSCMRTSEAILACVRRSLEIFLKILRFSGESFSSLDSKIFQFSGPRLRSDLSTAGSKYAALGVASDLYQVHKAEPLLPAARGSASIL